MRPIDTIVIHCSASPNGRSLFRGPGTRNVTRPVQVIDEWHAARGFKREARWRARLNMGLMAIGYHFVIYTNGGIDTGRHMDEVGAHAAGHNARSLGVCLIGTDAYTARQWDELRELLLTLRTRWPDARVIGHRDLSPDRDGDGAVTPREWTKTCPGFDVAAWLAGGMAALADHTCEALD